MKPKKCRDCGKTIKPKTKDSIIQNGYLLATCRPCKRIEARVYAAKKRQLMKGSYWDENN